MESHLFTIAPHGKFLDVLAERVLDGTLLNGWPQDNPFWLSDVTIVLPTRRARLALAEAFARRGHYLLPDIRTFGGEESEEEPFLPAGSAPPVPRAIAPRERQLAIAHLVDAWARTADGAEVLATPPNAAEILSLAASLGEVIDDLTVEGVPYSAVRALPPEHLAVNWQQTLRFLDIALTFWPQKLADRGLADAAHVRNLRLLRQAETAEAVYGERPVIAAGSTGSIPATAMLIRAITRLKRGALVLPGLDTTLTAAEHDRLLNENATPHGHPQYGLVKLLRRLGTGPAAFVELATGSAARTSAVRSALAPAATTGWWLQHRDGIDLDEATRGLTTIAAHTADEEARAIAIAARAALADRRTVGIVSPDQTLARRIAAELRRFDILVDDPAGTPLYQSAAGRIARLTLSLVANRYDPVDLVALLRNPSTSFGFTRRDLAAITNRIELGLLRGRRVRPGLAGLRLALSEDAAAERPRLLPEAAGQAGALFDRMETALAPLEAVLAQPTTAPAFAAALMASYAAVTAGNSPAGSDELLAWSEDLAAHREHGPALPPYGLDGVLAVLMQGASVRGQEQRRDDIFIWGQLEARLQNPDLMILAGLNEDIWPRAADPGPWLSRGMRIALGLEPPERRQGQAAHDFEMAIGNGDAILAFSERIGTAPALPSRLVQRFEAFLGEPLAATLRERGRRYIDEARAIDVAGRSSTAPRPMPRPPAEQRPRTLSITEIEPLYRSPYDIYAKHVLGLRKLPPLGEEVDARERGIMVHDVFARFVDEGIDPGAPDALDRLKVYAEEAFANLDAIGERRAIWLRRFETAAVQFLAHERSRQDGVAVRHAEIDGLWAMPNGFTLKGRADRIDLLQDGTAEIIDFKTGSLPSATEMSDLMAPQLPLEAAMLEAGAFAGLAPAETSALTFIKIGLGPSAFLPSRFKTREGTMAAAHEAAHRLNAIVDALLKSDALPMTSQVLPVPARRYRGDYDHLARVDEWAINEGDDSE